MKDKIKFSKHTLIKYNEIIILQCVRFEYNKIAFFNPKRNVKPICTFRLRKWRFIRVLAYNRPLRGSHTWRVRGQGRAPV